MLQSVKHALTEKWKGSSTIAYSLYKLEFVHFSFDDSSVGRQSQPSLDRFFVLQDSENCALQLAYPAGFDTSKPLVELLACTRPEHLNELLDQRLRLLDFRMESMRASSAFLVRQPLVLEADEGTGTSPVAPG